jgi:putative flippase GtrA
MKLKSSFKILVIVCLLGLFFLWAFLLNASYLNLKNYWLVLFILYLIGNFTLYKIGEKYSRFTTVTRFMIIGVLNTLVDLGTLSLLIYFSGLTTGWYYTLFKSLSFSLALANSYIFNSHFSFNQSGGGDPLAKIAKFVAVNLMALLINTISASALNRFNFLAIEPSNWGLFAALLASFLGVMINFVGYKFWVFRK